MRTSAPTGSVTSGLPSSGCSSSLTSTGSVVLPGLPSSGIMCGYSDAVKACPSHNADDNEPFQVVNRRKPAKKSIIGDRTTNTTFQGVVKKSVICVNRLDPQTNVETVSRFLETNGIHVFSCVLAKRKTSDIRARKFSTMCVCVSQLDLDKVFCPDMWPAGVTVRPWTFKQK